MIAIGMQWGYEGIYYIKYLFSTIYQKKIRKNDADFYYN